MENSRVMAVPALPAESAGAISFWRLAGTVDHARLAAEWAAQGLDEKYLPSLPTPSVALHRAVMEQHGASRLVRALPKRDGWAIVSESAPDGANLDYSVSIKVRLDALGSAIIEPADAKEAAEILAAYESFLHKLTLGDISGWLAETTRRLRAVPLRDTGGVYFLPRPSVEEWTRTGDALRAASACVVHRIPALQTADAVEAILDAVALETESEAKKMEEEIGRLGQRGLESRQNRCEEVEAKVVFYEKLLGKQVENLHDRLERLQASIAAAMLAASGDDAQVDLAAV